MANKTMTVTGALTPICQLQRKLGYYNAIGCNTNKCLNSKSGFKGKHYAQCKLCSCDLIRFNETQGKSQAQGHGSCSQG